MICLKLLGLSGELLCNLWTLLDSTSRVREKFCTSEDRPSQRLLLSERVNKEWDEWFEGRTLSTHFEMRILKFCRSREPLKSGLIGSSSGIPGRPALHVNVVASSTALINRTCWSKWAESINLPLPKVNSWNIIHQGPFSFSINSLHIDLHRALWAQQHQASVHSVTPAHTQTQSKGPTKT